MFPETRWTLIAAATLNGDADGRRALEMLCQAYWPAVVAFLQSRGHLREEAEDIAQEFFAALVQSRLWESANQARGRFRSFLLGALMRIVSHHTRHQSALKRGGDTNTVAFELLEGGGVDFAASDANEQWRFDRAWAVRVLERAMEALSEEWDDKAELLLLMRFLPLADDVPSYAQAAEELSCTLAAFKLRVHRFRARYRELIEREVASTVSTPQEVAEELAYLERILRDPGFE